MTLQMTSTGADFLPGSFSLKRTLDPHLTEGSVLAAAELVTAEGVRGLEGGMTERSPGQQVLGLELAVHLLHPALRPPADCRSPRW